MSFSTEQLSTYTKHIDLILANSDLTTVSVKKVRTTLQDIIGNEPQLSGELKPRINELIQERFAVAEELAEQREQEEEEERPLKKRKTSKVKDEVKDEDGDDDEDSKLAALLQAEENRSSRATRGARTARAAAPKTKKVVKRKKKEKVESEPEYDSEGNEIRKVKKGAFHKEYLLSDPLALLVGGETQLSRPQCVKKIWEHIKANDLQVPTDKRQIMCDEKMRAVFKQDQVHMFTMNKLLGKHLYPLEGEEETTPKPKKEKVVKEMPVKKVVKKEVKEMDGKRKQKSEKVVKDESDEEEGDEQYAKSEDEETPEVTPSESPEETPSSKEDTPASKESTPESEED